MTVTNYLWDEDSYLEEYDDAGTTTAAYTNEPTDFGSVISQRRNSETSFNHYDAQGSTHQLTDQNENVTDTFLYDAWGNEVDRTGTTTAPFRYIGEFGYYFDEETDSYYVRARVYQPLIGRWWSVDPMGFLDGLNLFLYLNNDTVNNLDPTGFSTRRPNRNSGKNQQKKLRQKLKKRLQDEKNKYKNYCFFSKVGLDALISKMIVAIDSIKFSTLDLLYDTPASYNPRTNTLDLVNTDWTNGVNELNIDKVPIESILHELTHVLDDFNSIYLSDSLLGDIEKAEGLAFSMEYIYGNIDTLMKLEDTSKKDPLDCQKVKQNWTTVWSSFSSISSTQVFYTTKIIKPHIRNLTDADVADLKAKLGVSVSCSSLIKDCYSKVAKKCCLTCPANLPTSVK